MNVQLDGLHPLLGPYRLEALNHHQTKLAKMSADELAGCGPEEIGSYSVALHGAAIGILCAVSIVGFAIPMFLAAASTKNGACVNGTLAFLSVASGYTTAPIIPQTKAETDTQSHL